MRTALQWSAVFRERFGVELPAGYPSVINQEGSWVTPVADRIGCKRLGMEHEPFYPIGALASLVEYEADSIFAAQEIRAEWSLPEGIVLIESDPHLWLALDYRKQDRNPTVVLIDDEGNIALVANSFGEFVSQLLPYSSVYNDEGELLISCEQVAQGAAISMSVNSGAVDSE
ncbi:SMI1/KNR4 family protein [Pseudomarimonas arenosa]|uniref:SMI1/KNR4 family protein n=1 Tax=Pseudomarimonas arenosa TaxID=2774145 RepID=A0AAW3ZQP3_9GAMM|nr:SMI1/KNR4 family protein [Pseudomarimonas arenosa]